MRSVLRCPNLRRQVHDVSAHESGTTSHIVQEHLATFVTPTEPSQPPPSPSTIPRGSQPAHRFGLLGIFGPIFAATDAIVGGSQRRLGLTTHRRRCAHSGPKLATACSDVTPGTPDRPDDAGLACKAMRLPSSSPPRKRALPLPLPLTSPRRTHIERKFEKWESEHVTLSSR